MERASRRRKEITVPDEQIKPFLKSLAMGKNRFLYGLDATADDRLTWSPGGNAYSPLQLAGRLTAFLGFLTHMVTTGAMPERRGEAPPEPESRDAAKEMLGAAFDRLRAAALAFTEADLARSLPTPWGEPTTVERMLPAISSVVNYFQGQLNYLQLIYGDTNANVPPDWGKEEI
jgi:hypothetical protein